MKRKTDKDDYGLQTEFERIVREHKAAIYTVCYMFSDDNATVADMFQEVLINIRNGLENFQGRSSAGTWIWGGSASTPAFHTRRSSGAGRMPFRWNWASTSMKRTRTRKDYLTNAVTLLLFGAPTDSFHKFRMLQRIDFAGDSMLECGRKLAAYKAYFMKGRKSRWPAAVLFAPNGFPGLYRADSRYPEEFQGNRQLHPPGGGDGRRTGQAQPSRKVSHQKIH